MWLQFNPIIMFSDYKKSWFYNPPDGWEELGEIKPVIEFDGRTNKYVEMISQHDICRTRLSVGKEEGKLFKYCSMCMVKVDK